MSHFSYTVNDAQLAACSKTNKLTQQIDSQSSHFRPGVAVVAGSTRARTMVTINHPGVLLPTSRSVSVWARKQRAEKLLLTNGLHSAGRDLRSLAQFWRCWSSSLKHKYPQLPARCTTLQDIRLGPNPGSRSFLFVRSDKPGTHIINSIPFRIFFLFFFGWDWPELFLSR